MNWPELLIGALIGAFAQAVVEMILPGPSMLLTLIRRALGREDRAYMNPTHRPIRGRELYWRPHALESWHEPDDDQPQHPRAGA